MTQKWTFSSKSLGYLLLDPKYMYNITINRNIKMTAIPLLSGAN